MLNSNTYSISFALLVPKWKILRGDVLPFVVIYTILGYVFWAYEEDDDMNLYIRLTAIAAGFVHCNALSM